MSKNILLTGCSRGVGISILKQLLADGNIVYGISRNSNSELEAIKIQYPSSFFHHRYDLKNIHDIKAEIFDRFVTSKISLDAYINNAAIAYDDIITNIKLTPLEEMFSINVFSPYIITKYAIRNMLLHKTAGAIVHLSSISVHTAYKGLAMYASTKGALEAFSKGTAREWGERGIRSNCLVAGFMETDMSNLLTTEQKDRIYKRTSLKTATSIDSVASTIKFLISSDAISITGQNFHVDSGTI